MDRRAVDPPGGPDYLRSSSPAARRYLDALAGREIRGLSLQQPWASLLAHGFVFPSELKTIETRSWSSEYRGPVAIHASKSLYPVSREALLNPPIQKALRRIGIYSEKDLPLGVILAVGELSDIRKIEIPVPFHLHAPALHVEGVDDYVRLPAVVERVMAPPAEPELHFGNYTPGRYAWIFSEMVLLAQPIALAGNRSLWKYKWPS